MLELEKQIKKKIWNRKFLNASVFEQKLFCLPSLWNRFFQKIRCWRKNYFLNNRDWVEIFWKKSDFEETSTPKNSYSPSKNSVKTTNCSLFVLYRKHDIQAKFWKRKFWKKSFGKESDCESISFSKWDLEIKNKQPVTFWIENFSSCHLLKWCFHNVLDFELIRFSPVKFWFEKLSTLPI